jgi:hypothetical protein
VEELSNTHIQTHTFGFRFSLYRLRFGFKMREILMQETDKILGSKLNDLHGQIRKKRTFLTFFRIFCMIKVQKL